ncbi:MAG: type II toxin-antitoxin system Phd/YefM family antitoxin, partial [Chloroflexota bacterium]
MTEQIGIRELRQNAGEWLRRVKEGEFFEITDRGRPVALLVPRPEGGNIERMIAVGHGRRRAAPSVGRLAPAPALRRVELRIVASLFPAHAPAS